MRVLTYAYRVVVANVLTIFYTVLILLYVTFNSIRNLFKNPARRTKLRLEPPACLTDPKYGVHKYIKVNNIKLHYVESGDPSKPLMIFVHGFPEFWYSWRNQIVEFNKDYWCVTVDMRGYGDSEKPEKISAYHIDVLIEDLRDLVRQLGREKFILIGHDWGGIISCRFRDVYPDVLDAVVLLSSCSREAWFHQLWTTFSQFLMSWYLFFFRFPAIPEKFMQINDLQLYEDTMMFEGKGNNTEQDIECYKYWFGKQKAFRAPVNYYRANFMHMLPKKKYDEAKVPFLAALAEHEAYLDQSLHGYMKKEYAHIETVLVKGCGHGMQQEEPIRVNKMIREFLAKHKI